MRSDHFRDPARATNETSQALLASMADALRPRRRGVRKRQRDVHQGGCVGDLRRPARGAGLQPHAEPDGLQSRKPEEHSDGGRIGALDRGCFRPTGLGSSEISLGIAKDGTVLVAPAYTERGVGVARSSDNGVTWQPLPANFGGDAGHSRVQPFMDLDPTSDRTYFVTSVGVDGPGLDLSLSTDQGTTWTHQVIAPTDSDWMKIFTGPRIATDPGTGTIVYASVPNPSSTLGPDHQEIFRSTDGGMTWSTNVAGTALTLMPSVAVSNGWIDAALCPSAEQIIFSDGAVAADGTIYLPFRLCKRLAIATSHDEGTTWQVALVPGSSLPPYSGLATYLTTQNVIPSEAVAVDTAGDVYLVWNDAANLLHLTASKDGGVTWTGGQTPVVASAPGVTFAVLATVTAADPGRVAIAYLGSKDGKAFDGYMTESLDALDPTPTFASLVVNDPAKPLFANGFDNDYANVVSGGDLDEFIQVKYAPDGDVWASFLEEMCPGAMPTKCQWDYAAHANSIFQGAVGRLVHRP
jgi:hypothetical protein